MGNGLLVPPDVVKGGAQIAVGFSVIGLEPDGFGEAGNRGVIMAQTLVRSAEHIVDKRLIRVLAGQGLSRTQGLLQVTFIEQADQALHVLNKGLF